MTPEERELLGLVAKHFIGFMTYENCCVPPLTLTNAYQRVFGETNGYRETTREAETTKDVLERVRNRARELRGRYPRADATWLLGHEYGCIEVLALIDEEIEKL
jgi:hypothetical protein